MQQVEGKVIQIMGPVVDVKFEGDHIPEIYNAIEISSEGFGSEVEVNITAWPAA